MPPLPVRTDDPWDLWWVCRRAAASLAELGLAVTPGVPAGSCARCWQQVLALVGAAGVADPDPAAQRCSCFYDWAVAMRQPGGDPTWPALRTQLAMIKPTSASRPVRAALDRDYRVLAMTRHQLSTSDIRRLYPDAYGAAFVAAQDGYLVGAWVDVLILLARTDPPPDPGQVKTRVRADLGHTDLLRNHLHMPDSPGDTLCDVAHLAGTDMLADLYERHERDRAEQRLAHYRAVLAPERSGSGHGQC
jgi:hypothetical protein